MRTYINVKIKIKDLNMRLTNHKKKMEEENIRAPTTILAFRAEAGGLL